MKNLICLMIGVILYNSSLSQTKPDTINFDLLLTPTTPAATLINFKGSTIESPTEPVDFLTIIQNSTNNFSVIPNDFALQFAPAWIFGGKNITWEKYQSNAVGNNIWNTLSISLAKSSMENEEGTLVSGGLKFSILRGKDNFAPEAIKAKSEYRTQLQNINNIVAQEIINDEELKRLNKLQQNAAQKENEELVQFYEADKNKRKKTIETSINQKIKEPLDSLNTLAGKIKNYARVGFKLDFAGGVSYKFPNDNTTKKDINNVGVWLTGGNTWGKDENKFSLLASVKYLYSRDDSLIVNTPSANIKGINSIDYGIKVEYIYKRFVVSAEYLRRNFLENAIYDNTDRFSINLDYKILKNKSLNFGFGKNFDDTITKDGSLIATLNFILGFGGQKVFD